MSTHIALAHIPWRVDGHCWLSGQRERACLTKRAPQACQFHCQLHCSASIYDDVEAAGILERADMCDGGQKVFASRSAHQPAEELSNAAILGMSCCLVSFVLFKDVLQDAQCAVGAVTHCCSMLLAPQQRQGGPTRLICTGALLLAMAVCFVNRSSKTSVSNVQCSLFSLLIFVPCIRRSCLPSCCHFCA